MSNKIYETAVINYGGTAGRVEVKNKPAIETSSPTRSPNPKGYDPEQLIGASWSTCLNATIQSLLQARKDNRKSFVKVEVSFNQEKPGSYYFELNAYGAVEGLSLEETEKIVMEAHRRCPVSKLIEANPHVHVYAVEYV